MTREALDEYLARLMLEIGPRNATDEEKDRWQSTKTKAKKATLTSNN